MRNLLSAALVLVAVQMGGQAIAQDADAGKALFRKCAGCHRIGEGAKNSYGPLLTGVVGRPAASVEGYAYSSDLRAAGAAGLVWSEDLIFQWLQNPSDFLARYLGKKRGNAKMQARFGDVQERRDLIAYLATFSPKPAAADAGTGNVVCVENASAHDHVFAVETREGARRLAPLAPGGQLCSDPTDAADAIVSVFETAHGMEGCSRIVPVGQTEKMTEYAEFDRCGWGSHKP